MRFAKRFLGKSSSLPLFLALVMLLSVAATAYAQLGGHKCGYSEQPYGMEASHSASFGWPECGDSSSMCEVDRCGFNNCPTGYGSECVDNSSELFLDTGCEGNVCIT